MKKSSRFYNACFLSFCGIFSLVLIALVLMQTAAFRKQVTEMLVVSAKKKGINLELENLSGFAPVKWSFDKATVDFGSGKELVLEKVKLKIAFFPLFKKQLSVSFLGAKYVRFSSSYIDEIGYPFAEVHLSDLPFSISAGTVRIETLSLHSSITNKDLALTVKGKAKIDRHLKEIRLDLVIEEPTAQNIFQIQLLSSEKKDAVRGSVNLALKNGANLCSFFNLPLSVSMESSVGCRGKWSYWQALKRKSPGSSLAFTVRSKIPHLSVPSVSFLNRKWGLDAKLSLGSDLSSDCEHFSIESDWIRFLGRISLSPKFTPKEGSAIITIENLSEFSSFCNFPLGGRVEAKTGLKGGAFLFSASSPSLTLGSETFSDAFCKVEATLEENEWVGTALCSLEDPELPWKGSSDFTFKASHITVRDLSLAANQAKFSGSGSINTLDERIDGSFFVLIPELRPFRKIFPNSDLDGKIGGHFSFCYENSDFSVDTDLLLKNVRYRSNLLNMAELRMQARNLVGRPSGIFSLVAENLLTRTGQISNLSITSSPLNEEFQTYLLEAYGICKEPFGMRSSGSFTKKNKEFTVLCKEFFGDAFKVPFEVKPFTVERKQGKITLSDYSLKIGEGTLQIDGDFSESALSLKTKASRLPLDVFTIFYPNIGLSGYGSLEGSLSLQKEKTEGYLLATLEEASLPQTEAKGSLQAHLNQNILQLHAHIYGTKEQFIDWTATVPVAYRYGPLKVNIDPNRPLASEFTAQGELDNIFAFLQLANQKTSGWITSRLFLSGTYATPYLNGDIDLQKGVYENYFSGTRASEIDLKIAASGSTLELAEFSAKDRQKGSITGKGTLLLDKKEHFPFEIRCRPENFYLIRSNLFETMATGDVIVTGTSRGALAKGDLAVTGATFTLSDKLPSDIPTLPIEYVNKPIHLQQSEIITPPEYPFLLDLHLTANDTVFIKGKGLSSEWEGNVVLTGTPTKLVGKGNLTLKKGDFTFSGKTFALLQGDLSFSDKPQPEAHLKITGQLTLPAATIIANLQGPLTSPRLTFQSIPALPTGSILSLILFNKDISEISPLQALQLAQAIMSFSGNGGPDVMESIRKTIGVDKLNIAGKEGTDEIALQIGWCIAHGVTVSLSQSATSSDITIEVDLKNGFIFEAETQNQEEGKFSLKWNCNY